ncbi:MAG: cyclic peptide export ABC transporter [Chitinophagaceae bacterium]
MNKVVSITQIVVFSVFVLLILYGIFVVFQGLSGKRKTLRIPSLAGFLKGLLLLSPVIVGVLLLPFLFTGTPMSEALIGFYRNNTAVLLGSLVLGIYVIYWLTSFFPSSNKYVDMGVPLVLLSPVPSVANACIIFIINSFLNHSELPVSYMAFYFCLAVYLFTYVAREIKLLSLDISENITMDLNRNIIRNVFLSDFQQFEKKQRNRLFLVLSDDVNLVSVFANNLVLFYTNMLTVLIIMTYFFFLNKFAVLGIGTMIVLILLLHYALGVKAAALFKKSANVKAKYTEKILGVVNGFKELSIHRLKRTRYRKEIEQLCGEYTAINQLAFKKYVDRVMVSDMSFVAGIGLSCFLLPIMFHMERRELIAYVLAVLFMWGPVNTLIRVIPELVSVKTSLKRIKDFIGTDSLFGKPPADLAMEEKYGEGHDFYPLSQSSGLEVEDLYFEYQANQHSGEQYYIGPLNFSAPRNQITFIVGGNGSGKTTLAKVLCGLYGENNGEIKINGISMNEKERGEYFSVIFSDFHLFHRVYTHRELNSVDSQKLVELMKLQGKVGVDGDSFSTIDLSRGQSKRLAIIQCMLEDRPIFLFDECAADQDPDFKHFFYHEMLPEIKRLGKVLIVITHDDAYFDVADRIYKMETGKIKLIKTSALSEPLTDLAV